MHIPSKLLRYLTLHTGVKLPVYLYEATPEVIDADFFFFNNIINTDTDPTCALTHIC